MTYLGSRFGKVAYLDSAFGRVTYQGSGFGRVEWHTWVVDLVWWADMRIACLWGLRVSGRQVRQELPALPVCLPQSQPQVELQLRLHGPPRRSSSFPARLLLKFSKIAWCERRLSFWYWIKIISKVFNAKRTNCFKVKQEISANLYLRQYISTLTVYNANVSKLCIFLHYRVNMALRKIFVVFRFIHTEWKHMRRKTYFWCLLAFFDLSCFRPVWMGP